MLIERGGAPDTERVKQRLLSLVEWSAGRAWSRAGAVAQVLGRGTPRRVLGLATRVALLFAGSVTIGVGVAVMLWNDFGPGPLDVFIGAIRTRTGLPLTVAVWATVGSLMLVAWALGRRPGLGTVTAPLVIGPSMQLALTALDRLGAPSSLVVHLLIHVAAVVTVGVGSGALIVSGLGAGTGELLAAAASDRSGRPEARVRLAFEATWVVVGVALGGPIGVGTVVVAALIGPAVQHGYRAVDGIATRSRRQLAVAFG